MNRYSYVFLLTGLGILFFMHIQILRIRIRIRSIVTLFTSIYILFESGSGLGYKKKELAYIASIMLEGLVLLFFYILLKANGKKQGLAS
jgi:uncharacterized membrane protein